MVSFKHNKSYFYDDIVNQIIWNNKRILIQDKSIFIKHLIDHEIIKIGDLISDNGRFIESDKILQTSLSPIQYFNLMSIVNSIPNDWRLNCHQTKRTAHPSSFE